jgi:hypothetical protein
MTEAALSSWAMRLHIPEDNMEIRLSPVRVFPWDQSYFFLSALFLEYQGAIRKRFPTKFCMYFLFLHQNFISLPWQRVCFDYSTKQMKRELYVSSTWDLKLRGGENEVRGFLEFA